MSKVVRSIRFLLPVSLGLGLVISLMMVFTACAPAEIGSVVDVVPGAVASLAKEKGHVGEPAGDVSSIDASSTVAEVDTSPPAVVSAPASPGSDAEPPPPVSPGGAPAAGSAYPSASSPGRTAGGQVSAPGPGSELADVPGVPYNSAEGGSSLYALPAMALSAATPAGGVAVSPAGAAGMGSPLLAPLSPPMPGADLAVCLATERVWGVVGVGETVTVAVNGAQMGADLADGVGFFWTTLYDSSGDRPGLGAGDAVAIYADGAQESSVTLRSITGQVDVVNDVVAGSIGGATGFPLDVTVYFADGGEPSLTAYSQTVSTDGSGNFSADFTGIWDIIADDAMVVGYVEDGVEVHQHIYASRIVVLPPPFGSVNGWTAPGLVVTATAYSATATVRDQVTGTAGSDGKYGLALTFVEGDTVFVEIEGGAVMSRTVDHLTYSVDASSDEVAGEAPAAGAVVRGRTSNLTPLGWQSVQVSAVADGSGDYTLAFGAVADMMPGTWAGAFVSDEDGDELALWGPSASVEVQQTWNQVSGRGPSPVGPASEGRAVTLTLASDPTAYVKTMNHWAWYEFNEEDGLPDIGPGEVVTVEVEGYAWQGVVEVMTMTVEADPDNNWFTGAAETPSDRVELYGGYYQGQLYPAGGDLAMLATASSPFTALPVGFDVNGDLYYDLVHRTADEYAERISARTEEIGVWPYGGGVGGALLPPGVSYTITVYTGGGSQKVQTTGNSDGTDGGFWWMTQWEDETLDVGDQVQVQSAAGFSRTIEVLDITIDVDLDTGIISGQGPKNALLQVHVGEGDPPPYQGFVPTNDGGQYAVAAGQLQEAQGDGSLAWGDSIGVTYYDADNDWFAYPYPWPQIRAYYNMEGQNDVWGNDAPAGATIRVTVTHPVSGVVATGTTAAGACDWCGPYDYCADFPDGVIVADNAVTVDFGDDLVDSMTVLPVEAEADPDTDVVTITTTPGYYVGFNADGPNGWWEWWWSHDSVEVGPSGVVVFDVSGEYDIVVGTEFNVHVDQEHGHQTHYSFWLPAPELSLDKWNDSGYASPGGVVLYGFNYWNDGNGAAEDTLIVDTLPPSTTWSGDTSGVTPEIGSDGVITWNLGTVDQWSEGGFMVTLDVDSGVPTGTSVIQSNCAVITSTTPGYYDPGNIHSCTGEVDVWESEVDVGVDKWAHPNDPTPGEEFEYHIDTCNNRGAAVASVWLTDTLPLSTTFLGWSSDFEDTTYWTAVDTGGDQVVFYAPGFPGWKCERLQLRLLLDAKAQIGTTLYNHIVIDAAGDVDSDNDQRLDDNGHVSPPRYDMRVDKWFNDGQLVPGGEINYGIGYRNEGNAAVHVWITDTLPAGTSFGQAWMWGWGTLYPTSVTDDYVVWDLGVVEVNENSNFNIQLTISDTVAPGAVLTNCATVGITQTEDTPWDNVQCIANTIYAAGQPNLYVHKEIGSDYEPGNDTINYRINFGNYGDQTVYNVTLTETLPADTSLDWYDINWGWNMGPYTDTSTSSELVVEFARIEPGWNSEIRLDARLDDPGARFRWYTNTVEIDTPPDDANSSDNADAVVSFSGGEVDWVDLDVYGNGIWGCAPSGPWAVTTAYRQETFGGDCFDWNTDELFEPGDVVTVEAGAATHPVVIEIPAPFDAYASSITDTVWGQIDALDHEWVEVDLSDGPRKDVQTDGSGGFSASFADVPRGGEGQVRYETEIDYAEVTFHRSFQSPDLLITVDYDDNWINGNYEPGHTVWLTLTESDGVTVKATAQLATAPIPDWGGQSGFSTQGEDWSPQYPDIQPGDWVYGLVNSASYTTAVHVGTIDSGVDVDTDVVSGTIKADWLAPDLVEVRCEIHEDNGESIGVSNVDPDGGSFSCDFGGLYDIVPGTNVAVNYREPDGNYVQAHPDNPAPYMRIQKWADGIPGQGGNLAFRLQYMNQGGLAAADVVISETLQGMTYITDTSGLSHSGSGVPGDPIVWQLGTVDPQQDWIEFIVFVEVTEAAGNRITNTARIATSNPFDQGDQGEKENWWWTDVQDNGTQLSVNKDAWTHDPLPDSEFVYTVNACNGGEDNTNSTWTTVTDTLPLSTTLMSWWADDPGWSAVVEQDRLLVVQRPTIDAHRCTQIYLRVYLTDTVSAGDELCNQAEIFATNDGETSDNKQTWCHNVGEPHTNLGVDKWWSSGQLVPGGEIRYDGQYYNNGNLSVDDVSITETVPADASLVEWRHYDSNWNEIGLVSPTFVPPNQYVWDVGTVENGESGRYQILLRIDGDADPGTVLTNTIEISSKPDEESYDDNVDAEVEMVYDYGPNLRVRKDGYWHDWGSDTRQIEYNVTVENVGTEQVNWVTITDTYPSEMYMTGGLGMGFWRWWDWRDDPASHSFTITLEMLEPGWSVGFNFYVVTDTNPIPEGLILTNTVEVMLDPDDVSPDDNVDEAVLTTGPDLWVKKKLVAGDLLPGELITLSLAFGNAAEDWQWWWNLEGTAWLTDTLPAGLEYVTSTQHWCGWTEWCGAMPDIDGDEYTWQLWPLSAGEWNEIYLTVRITDTATGLDTFTNWVEIASDQPISDTEPYYDDNVTSYDVVIDLPSFEVNKVYESSRVAGTAVTYTLTVTNSGNSAGTSAVLSDTLPAGLTYDSGDGSYDGADVTWSLPSIAAGGGTATAWFRATLPCAAGQSVVNDTYLVAASDEGVSSPVGAAVSLDTISPTLTAAITHTLGTIVDHQTVYFTATASTDGSTPLSYAWDFGDGSVGSGLTASHAYTEDGPYTVVFTATDPCGYTAVQKVTLVIEMACTPLTSVSFTYAPSSPLVNAPVTLTASTLPVDATTPITYSWVFGDGDTTTVWTASVAHTYTISGTKTVTVTVYNPCTPAGVSYQGAVIIAPRRIFLPLVFRNY